MIEQTERRTRADLVASKSQEFFAQWPRSFPFGPTYPKVRNATRVWRSWAFLGVLVAVPFFAGCHYVSGLGPLDFTLSLSPSQVTGGTSASGQVTLDGRTIPGEEISLSSSNPSVAKVPGFLAVPAGDSVSVPFTVVTSTVTKPTQVFITATSFGTGENSYGSRVHTVVLTVNPPAVVSVTLNPATVMGGAPSTGTVTLNSPAPPGGAVVMLSSNNTAAATVPASVAVPAGATTAMFAVTTIPGTAQVTPTITASYNGSASAQLTVNPPPPTLTSISLTRGYQGKSYMVTLTGTNFTPGATVNAGTGVTVTNLNVSSDGTMMTGTFNIGGPTAAPTGTHYVSVTTPSGTTHNLVGFIVEAIPTLTGINPASGVQGKTGLLLNITGTNFDPGATVTIGGTGVTVTSNSVSADQTTITVTVDIAADATLGSHGVIVNTNGEVLSVPNVTFTVNPATSGPTLTSITPPSGAQGSSVNVTLTGTGFTSGATVNTGPGVNVTNLNVVNSTTITATFVIAADASLGAQNVNVTTPSGTSGNVKFTVNPPAPTLASISPTRGTQGSSFAVTLTGTGFASPMSVNTGVGVTASNVTVVNSTTATATFTIDPTAPTGSQNVSVTTSSGTSANTVNFTVDPTQACAPSSTAPCGKFLGFLDGTDPAGLAAFGFVINLDANGNVLGGTMDLKTTTNGPQLNLVLLPATSTCDSHGICQVQLNTQSGPNLTLVLKLDQSGNVGDAFVYGGSNALGILATGHIYRFSGPVDFAQVHGSFAVDLYGLSSAGGSQVPLTALGVSDWNANGNVTDPGATWTIFFGNNVTSSATATGAFSAPDPATNRSNITFSLSGGPVATTHGVAYLIPGMNGAPFQIKVIGSDPDSFYFADFYQQAQTGGFSSSFLPCVPYCVYMSQGATSSGQGHATIGQLVPASGGTYTLNYIQNIAGTTTSATVMGVTVNVGSAGNGTITPPASSGLPPINIVFEDVDKVLGLVLDEASVVRPGLSPALSQGIALDFGPDLPTAPRSAVSSLGVATISGGPFSGGFFVNSGIPTDFFGNSIAGGPVASGNTAFSLVIDTTGKVTGGGNGLFPSNVVGYNTDFGMALMSTGPDALLFIDEPQPSITSILPNTGPVGTSVTITGLNFGATQSRSTVKFNGTLATPTSWSDTSIVVPVPAGATTGNAIVTVGGVALDGGVFVVTP
jgi:hypothetical protein